MLWNVTLYLHEGHSINMVKYCLRSWQEEALFTVGPFSRKSIVTGPFMYQKTVNITFLTDGIFFLGVFSIQARSGKHIFCSFVNLFLTKTCFFLHTKHSSVNFIWFALLWGIERLVFVVGWLGFMAYQPL